MKCPMNHPVCDKKCAWFMDECAIVILAKAMAGVSEEVPEDEFEDADEE